VTKRLGNAEQLRVHQIHNSLGEASHHFIVYRVDDTTEQPTPYACQPFADTLDPAKGAPLMITQRAEETLTLPDGVAFTLQPDQMVRLELHYINLQEAAVDVTATATFAPIAEQDFTDEADFLFVGDIDIDIPPMSSFTEGPTFVPLPSSLAGSKFFAITGHEHQWGTDVYVEVAPSEGGAGTAVYDLPSFNWDEPDTVFHDPPFEVPSGGGFRVTCDWYNGSASSVGFGEGADDEMCFFWAYYYPSQGARVCAQTDQFGGVAGCCPDLGALVCNNIF
jgi:hypothetical protein